MVKGSSWESVVLKMYGKPDPTEKKKEESSATWFDEHFISPEVAERRYVEFRRGDTDLVLEYHANEAFDKPVRTLARSVARQAGGLIIQRRGYARCCPPQLRAWRQFDVYTNPAPSLSYHPSGMTLEEVRAAKVFDDRSGQPKWIDKNYRSTMDQAARHIMKRHGGNEMAESIGLVPAELFSDKKHEDVLRHILLACNEECPHLHWPDTAKYTLPAGEGWGTCLDFHHLAEDRMPDAETVYFGIEGSVKADAMLSYIIANGLNASVVSVPSITLWKAGHKIGPPPPKGTKKYDDRRPWYDELGRFARRHLVGRTVVIVIDADGRTNDLVVSQALRLRDQLHALGVARACVAAPPLTAEDEVEIVAHPVFGTMQRKGVDDHLALGGTLEELAVLDRQTDHQQAYEAVMSLGRADRTNRNARALARIPLYANSFGTVSKNISMYAGIIGCGWRAANEALIDLVSLGVAWYEIGGLSASHKYTDPVTGRGHAFDWDERPRIVFDERFRFTERKITLSEWLGENDMTQSTAEQLIDEMRQTKEAVQILTERLPAPAATNAEIVVLDDHRKRDAA